ncbi:MAG: arabinose-5-phosphate isomerase KdsD [Gammaproteobacteria bacterium]|nr:MAG: arabinose-5-phosphate isomerase KdsD [Gammaproteobacteria bacterium]
MNNDAFCKMGLSVINIELDAITALRSRISESFSDACNCILDCGGRVIVIGLGKSGHIGNKIAATMASTGTPAFFVHAAEAGHGDFGMITDKDVMLCISNSGETNELISLLPLLKRIGTKIIAMTGNDKSTLATAADFHLDVHVDREACPLGLAPTSSSTAALVMGDALAIALLKARGFTEEDFALSHPGGSLGRRLLLRITDIMHSGDRIPMVTESTHLKDTLVEMSEKGLGMTAIVDDQQHVVGIFTDGDLRRILDHEDSINISSAMISEFMHPDPKTIHSELLASEALQMMDKYKINGLFVVDNNNQLTGALNMHDLLRAGVV